MKNHDNYEVDDGKWANFDQKYNSKTSSFSQIKMLVMQLYRKLVKLNGL